jgi:hypothetical protein
MTSVRDSAVEKKLLSFQNRLNKKVCFVQILIGSILTIYGVVAPVLFFKWVELMGRDRNASRRERLLSRWVVLIATALWPIVLPLTYLELLERVRRQESRKGQTIAD